MGANWNCISIGTNSVKVEEKFSQTHPEHMQESDRFPPVYLWMSCCLGLREIFGSESVGGGGHECSIQLSSD